MDVHDIPVAAAPWDPYIAGGRTGSIEAFSYATIQGFRQEDGLLVPRETIQTLAQIGINDGDPKFQILKEDIGIRQPQMPRVILDLSSGGFQSELVMVTNRELLYLRNGAWRRLTPTYVSGTVEATNGSNVVTGTGTLWKTRGISNDSPINILQDVGMGPNNRYRISSVDSDVQLTLTNPWEGVTASGLNYTIRRTWGIPANDFETPFFAKFHNGDLYVAGPLVQHPTYFGGGAVIRVPNLGAGTADRSPSPGSGPTFATVEYLTAGDVEAVPGIEMLDEWIYIVGMEVLADGRVLLLTRFREADDTNPAAIAVSGTARLYYSGFDQTEWITEPGGFLDIVNHDQPATGLGKVGDAYTIHFADGIELAYPTPDVEPPLALPQRTSTTHGTIAPMALKTINGIEYFPCADAVVRVFDGRSTQVLTDVLRDELGQHSGSILQRCFAAFDGMRNRYRLFLPDREVDIIEGSTVEPFYTAVVEVDLDSGIATRSGFPAVITAVEDLPIRGNAPFGWVRALASTLVGVWNGPYSNNGETTFIAALAEGLAEDDPQFFVPTFSAVLGGSIYAESNFLDFGQAGVTKYIDHVTVWFRKEKSRVRIERWLSDNGLTPAGYKPLSQPFTVQISYAPGTKWYTASRTVTLNPTEGAPFFGDEDTPVHFFFPQASGERARIRLRPIGFGDLPDFAFGRRMVCSISRLQVHAQDLHPIEALRAQEVA